MDYYNYMLQNEMERIESLSDSLEADSAEVEQHAEIKEALDKWFEYEQIFVDRYHKDGLKNQYAPIYWLLDDNDDE